SRPVTPGMKRQELWTDEVVLVRRAPDEGTGSFDLTSIPFDGAFVRHGSSPELRASIEGWASSHDKQITIFQEFDSQYAILNAVLTGSGVGLLNYTLCRDHIARGNLVGARLEPPAIKNYGLIYRENSPPGPALSRLCEILSGQGLKANEPNLPTI